MNKSAWVYDVAGGDYIEAAISSSGIGHLKFEDQGNIKSLK